VAGNREVVKEDVVVVMIAMVLLLVLVVSSNQAIHRLKGWGSGGRSCGEGNVADANGDACSRKPE